MIQPTYVTFEQAKWLKEKGFDLPCFYYYENNKLIEPYLENGSSTDTEFKVELSDLLEHFNKWSKRISAPEQWQVVEWLRVEHGIWISVGNVYSEYTHWAYGIGKENKGMILPFRQGQDNHDYFNSPQEAYSAAFDYILNNLI
jgi:hypothetical protein